MATRVQYSRQLLKQRTSKRETIEKAITGFPSKFVTLSSIRTIHLSIVHHLSLLSSSYPTSHIQTCYSSDVPLDHLLASLHFREQFWISNDPSSILHFSARLIKSCDDTYNCPFKDIRQVCNILEAHASSPFIYDFHESESGPGDEIVGVF